MSKKCLKLLQFRAVQVIIIMVEDQTPGVHYSKFSTFKVPSEVNNLDVTCKTHGIYFLAAVTTYERWGGGGQNKTVIPCLVINSNPVDNITEHQKC